MPADTVSVTGSCGASRSTGARPSWRSSSASGTATRAGCPSHARLDPGPGHPGGHVYLAKDTRLRPELLTAMYPRLDAFRELRAQLDPRGVFVPDLARRLNL